MKCSKVRRSLYAYADGEGKASVRKEISLHLDNCSLCKKELDEITILNDSLRNKELPEVPSHIHEKIMFEIKNKSQKRMIHKGLRWNLIPVAASLLISLYFGVFFGTKTLPLTVARTEISALNFGQSTIYSDDETQETTNE
ncbi:MAG TPA: hypothetical protein PLE74_04235 [Candidatus Cloacimonadota bacterium]|nr:hypothetical protein [Candidatus Cloacimonadota bacterium]HPT71468.1 hypothetical protein [Candidatus Cloacimonadota bacterium]